jgi:hypothetical protein
MTKQKSKEQKHELTIQVYQVKNELTQYGYSKGCKGLIYFSTGYNAFQLGGDDETIAKSLVNHIQTSLKKNINLPFINFEYPNNNPNIAHYGDGFFGRPQIWHNTVMLKPLPKGKRDSLSRELNKIGSIEDKRGKTIELRA